jgi:Fe-S cluster assembly scaffold protein SufB
VQGRNFACARRGIDFTNISNWIRSKSQRALRANTETEAIERALDLVIAEHKSNRLEAEANDRFVKSGIEIKDVYGKLDQ